MADLQHGGTGHGNRLAGASSPYLLKHAHNPVDWYPWGDEAFAAARAAARPIHLSIGYYACHWCSVLEKESFEDEATARVLNENFVNIKVDREERPDLDRIYQVAHQMLTQNGGGWPLTMFLTHDDHLPFFGGTYFPREARFGLPAFRVVLQRVAQYYRERQPELRAQNGALLRAFAGVMRSEPASDAPVVPDVAPLREGRRQLGAAFDREFGGFGDPPKFPHAGAIERLLRDWHSTAGRPEPDLEALYMATLTLKRMAEGGLCDQLAGGFCRYSTDRFWMIPHFEKMLYDNAALLAVYATAALATGDTFFARVADETAAWLLRDLRSPEGGFYSSFDADSEGQEGRFYAWERDEVEAALTPAEWSVFAPRFGLDRQPNFEGRWHLHAWQEIEGAAGDRSDADARQLNDSARSRLLAIRARRVWPGRDDKILTSWNALAIRGLAIAARALRRPDLADAGSRALDFVRMTLWRDGRLLATCRDGRAHLNAYLDDYVFLADAVVELLQVRWRDDDLAFLCALLDAALAHFEDPAGGFFFTSDDHETLIQRPKSMADEATPSGNGVAAFVLQRVGYLLGNGRYLDAADRTLRAAWGELVRHPRTHPSLLTALEESLEAPEILLLRGEAREIGRWSGELGRLYAPRRLILAIPADARDLPPALASKPPRGPAVAYLCRGAVCSEPIESLGTLIERLRLGIGAAISDPASGARD